MNGTRQIDRILLIFNADSGRWSAFLDSARKALNLDSCTLCALTHGLAGERPEWVTAMQRLAIPVSYVHRDELTPALAEAAGGGLPCVIAETGGRYYRLLSPDEIAACDGSIEAFEASLRERAARNDLALPGGD